MWISGSAEMDGPAPAPLVVIDRLSVDYRTALGWDRVLHTVSLEIRPGETLGLVGESGSGKSTLGLQCLGWRRGLRRQAAALRVAGADLDRLDTAGLRRLRGRRIGFVPQNPTTALDPAWRVGDLIAEAVEVHGVARGAAARDRTARLLARVGLARPGVAQSFPHQLSGGQQQRVCIALALACDPDLVVLDEPTTGLDVTTQAQIVALLARLKAERLMAMLYITHDLGVIAALADRVAVMYAGHLAEVGDTVAVIGAPAHPYTRGLIASAPRIDGPPPGAAPLTGTLRRLALPPGCPFAPRCDHAAPGCAETAQRLAPAPQGSPGHRVACMRAAALAGDGDGRPAAARLRTEPSTFRDPVLTVSGLSVAYRPPGLLARRAVPVVRGAAFTIAAGEVLALVGESGSGKSTLARALIGLVPRAGGTVLLGREPLAPGDRARSPAQRRRLQYVFQNPDASLNPAATVGASLTRAARAAGRTGADLVAEALAAVQIDPGQAGRYPDELSGGQRQRVALARALIAEPDLILCDEILSALDVSVQAGVLALLARIRAERGLALLFITHDLAVVRGFADRVLVLFAGTIVQEAAAAALFAGARHPYAAALIAAAPRLVPAARPAPQPEPPPPPAPPAAAAGACVYLARCPHRRSVCGESPPPARPLPGGGMLRCHIPVDELAREAPDSRDGPGEARH